MFWSIIGHWSIPSLFIPALFGTLISFHPARSQWQSQPSTRSPQTPYAPFDPLTAAIIRLAAQIAYPLAIVQPNIERIDVIGFRWRVLNASVGLAFAFAEAIASAAIFLTKDKRSTAKMGPETEAEEVG
jgi:hypothetical protein